MAKEYKWVQVWVIQDEPGVLFAGEIVTITNSSGVAKTCMVENVFPYTTKAGKDLERATVVEQ